MNEVIQKYLTGFFKVFSLEFPRLLKEKKASITNKDNTVKIRFRLPDILDEIQTVDSKDENLLVGVTAQTIKNLLKSVFNLATVQAAFYGATHTCYNIDVDLIFELTGVSFSITDQRKQANSLFEAE